MSYVRVRVVINILFNYHPIYIYILTGHSYITWTGPAVEPKKPGSIGFIESGILIRPEMQLIRKNLADLTGFSSTRPGSTPEANFQETSPMKEFLRQN